MDSSSLHADVVLYLIKFVDQDDRFKLVLSWVLKENANERIDLRQRYSEHFTCEVISGNKIVTHPESEI
jgi:hypothetical protein